MRGASDSSATAPGGGSRLLALLAAAGALQGALLYGGGIALLHLLHAAPARAGDGLLLLAWCLTIYGAWGGGAFVAAGGLLRLARRVLAGGGRARRPPGPFAELLAGGLAFHGSFWVVAATYGITYDEVPWGPPAGPAGMLLYLGLRALAAALGALAAAWILARLALRLRGRALRRTVAFSLAALAAAHALLPVLLPAPRRPTAPPPPRVHLAASGAASAGAAGKLAILGLDGADWRVILPLVERGDMPHLARLMRDGAWGELATFPDSNSAVIWASIYSGLLPRDHRVLDFYTLRFGGMSEGVFPVHRTFLKEAASALQRAGLARVEPIDRGDLAAPLVWEIAAARGLPIGVVDGYYYSFPAPALGEGSFYLAYGADRFAQLARRQGLLPGELPQAPLYAQPPGLLTALAPLLERWEFDWQSAALLDLLGRAPQPPLVSFYAHQPDAVQHWHWRAYQPERFLRVPAAEVAAEGDRIPEFHRRLDAFLGELLARLEPGSHLMLLSDHGQSPALFHAMDTQHRHGPPGIFLLWGPEARSGAEIASADVLDVFPTALYLLGIPLPADAAGEVLWQALTPGLRDRRPPLGIATWRGLELARPDAAAADDPARAADELEKLRALGYIR